ncbi:MAG TPA: hypothetical protein VHQ95_20080 [Pyrinomonadaceae bacterium]|nr:hypothetical protein [Pyrinomonadaceae bacterium]
MTRCADKLNLCCNITSNLEASWDRWAYDALGPKFDTQNGELRAGQT